MTLKKNNEHLEYPERMVKKVQEEIHHGIDLLKTVKHPIISILGSHKGEKGDKWYDHCYKTAQELGKQGFAIMSGGGPGIMHAANSGAMSVNVPSIGIKAEFIEEEAITDKIYTHDATFDYLFVRRFVLAVNSQALIFYPGGYGTLNELFEYIVLMQTKMADTVPVILVGKEFWKGMVDWLQTVHNEGYFSSKDLELLHFVDTTEEILAILNP